MIIEINDSRAVRDIQEEFSKRFPLLKIEFFNTPHEREEPSNETPCQSGMSLGEIRSKHIRGIITIESHRETGSVEKEFEERFGLNVQIYRLQIDRWIQTAGTDILTLGEQSEIAADSFTYYNPDHQLRNNS